MRRVLAAVSFLTRFPVPGAAGFDAGDVGRGSLAFPLVGALLGALCVGARHLLQPALPAPLTAVLLLALVALCTGALHLDGLADMADGFGGGRTREDVLRIMRDHVIGAYGGVALLLVVGVKAAALAPLLERRQGWLSPGDVALVVGPTLSRWASVGLGRFLPYARKGPGLGAAITDFVGWPELAGASLVAVGVALGLCGWRGGVLLALVAAVSAAQGAWCVRRIGGVTGDTLGANSEVCEALVWTALVAMPGAGPWGW